MANDDSPELQIIIPAAGASSRLGHPKQDIYWHGQPLWQHVVTVATRVPDSSVTLVTGAWQPSDVPQAIASITVRHHPDWSAGMGASIAWGIQHTPKPKRGYLILLIDQWALSTETLTAFVHQWDSDRIQVATDTKYSGPPALFPVRYYADLNALRGDQGAKALYRQQDFIQCPLPGAREDLDTEEDLLLMQQSRPLTTPTKDAHHDVT